MKRKKDGSGLASITVLKLKLALDKEQAAELQRIAELCRTGRNAGSVNWLLRQNGLPKSPKQSERLIKSAKHGDKPKSESSVIYHAVREASPGLTATIHSMLANQIASYLAGRLDWREGKTEDGKRPRRADAILKHNARPPYFTSLEIPVRSVDSRFAFTDIAALNCRLTIDCRQSLQVRTASFSRGQKTILHELSAGTRKLADSKLLLKDDEWYWYVPVAFERPPISGGSEASLSAVFPSEETQGQADRPFALSLPDRESPWYVGDADYLLAQTRRVVMQRKMVGWRYRQRNGAGHGRQKIDGKMRKIADLHANIVAEFRRRLIVDIVRQCLRHGCGVLNYGEPSLPLREKAWFARNGLDWNWTRFATDLENALHREGIVLRKKLLKLKDAKTNAEVAAQPGV